MADSDTRGLLTKRERDFLQSGDAGGSNPRALRQRIRERLRQGVADMALLFDTMEERDIKQVPKTGENEFDSELRGDYIGTVGLLYRIAAQNGVKTEPLIWEGIHLAHEREHPDRVGEITVQINSISQDDLIPKVAEKVENGEPLTDIELRTLVENASLLRQGLEEYIHQQRTRSFSSLEQFIRNNPEVVEDGLEIIDYHLPDEGTNVYPDIIGRDSDGNLVLLVIVLDDRPVVDYRELGYRFAGTVEDYGGADRVRGIILLPVSRDELPEVSPLEDAEIEFLSLTDDVSLL